MSFSKICKHSLYLAAAGVVYAASMAPNSHALENIIRPYQSIRSSGMGGVMLSTGLYDQNFFGNPARVTANPSWKVQLPDLMVEVNSNSIDTVGTLLDGGSDDLSKLSGTVGKVNHGRIQTTFPGVYIPKEKWSFAFAFMTSTQFDFDIRRSYAVDPQALTDIGPAITVGRKLLEEDRLSVGLTTRATYRLATRSSYSLVSFLQGTSLSPSDSGGDGSMIEFDLGSTYRLPWKPLDAELTVAAAVNNLLGGRYSNLGVKLADAGSLPPQQPRTLGFGISARKDQLGPMTGTTAALEFQNIGNNSNGSLFRTVHLGGETRFGLLAFRAGLNQGYLAGGLGIDLKAFTLDLATYGEEMSLNVGGLQNRILAARIGFQI